MTSNQQPFAYVKVPDGLHGDVNDALKPCAICSSFETRQLY